MLRCAVLVVALGTAVAAQDIQEGPVSILDQPCEEGLHRLRDMAGDRDAVSTQRVLEALVMVSYLRGAADFMDPDEPPSVRLDRIELIYASVCAMNPRHTASEAIASFAYVQQNEDMFSE